MLDIMLLKYCHVVTLGSVNLSLGWSTSERNLQFSFTYGWRDFCSDCRIMNYVREYFVSAWIRTFQSKGLYNMIGPSACVKWGGSDRECFSLVIPGWDHRRRKFMCIQARGACLQPCWKGYFDLYAYIELVNYSRKACLAGWQGSQELEFSSVSQGLLW